MSLVTRAQYKDHRLYKPWTSYSWSVILAVLPLPSPVNLKMGKHMDHLVDLLWLKTHFDRRFIYFLVLVRSPLATGGRFQPFCWPTSATSGVTVCAPSCPNWKTSPESTDLSVGSKPQPRWDLAFFLNLVLTCDLFVAAFLLSGIDTCRKSFLHWHIHTHRIKPKLELRSAKYGSI